MSLKTFFILGLSGMMLDLDHMIPVVSKGVPIPEAWNYMVTNGVRDFHMLGVWLSFMVFLYCWISESNGERTIDG